MGAPPPRPSCSGKMSFATSRELERLKRGVASFKNRRQRHPHPAATDAPSAGPWGRAAGATAARFACDSPFPRQLETARVCGTCSLACHTDRASPLGILMKTSTGSSGPDSTSLGAPGECAPDRVGAGLRAGRAGTKPPA